MRSRRALLAGKTRQPIANLRCSGEACDSTWSGLSNGYSHAIPFGQHGECRFVRNIIPDEHRSPASPGWACHELFDGSALAELCMLDLENALPRHDGELIGSMGGNGSFHYLPDALGGGRRLAKVDRYGDRLVFNEHARNFGQRGQQPSNSVGDGWCGSRDVRLSSLEPDFGTMHTGCGET